MSDLETAIAIAVDSHQGQVDKTGRPYILHPLRMMLRLTDEAEMTVPVLHDVVEDTDLTMEQLRERGFNETILAALDGVTNREGESYEAFIDRAVQNPIARRVKLADLEDNMDVRRLKSVSDKDAARLSKYLRAWRSMNWLTKCLTWAALSLI